MQTGKYTLTYHHRFIAAKKTLVIVLISLSTNDSDYMGKHILRSSEKYDMKFYSVYFKVLLQRYPADY